MALTLPLPQQFVLEQEHITQMILYWQDLQKNLEKEMGHLSEVLTASWLKFVNPTQEAVENDKKDQDLKKEPESQFETWKQEAYQDPSYQAFLANYGERTAKSVIKNIQSMITHNPEAYGADDMPVLLQHHILSNSQIRQDLATKYPLANQLIKHLQTVKSLDRESDQIIEAVSDFAFSEIGDLTQFEALFTAKDKETAETAGSLAVVQNTIITLAATLLPAITLPADKKAEKESLKERRSRPRADKVKQQKKEASACKRAAHAVLNNKEASPEEHTMAALTIAILNNKKTVDVHVKGHSSTFKVPLSEFALEDTKNIGVKLSQVHQVTQLKREDSLRIIEGIPEQKAIEAINTLEAIVNKYLSKACKHDDPEKISVFEQSLKILRGQEGNTYMEKGVLLVLPVYEKENTGDASRNNDPFTKLAKFKEHLQNNEEVLSQRGGKFLTKTLTAIKRVFLGLGSAIANKLNKSEMESNQKQSINLQACGLFNTRSHSQNFATQAARIINAVLPAAPAA